MLGKLLKIVSSKAFFVVLAIIFQLLLFVVPTLLITESSLILRIIFTGLGLITALFIIYSPINPDYKLTWIVLILLAPIFGFVVYLLFGAKQVPKNLRVRDEKLNDSMKRYLIRDTVLGQELFNKDPIAHKQSKYISKASKFPLYKKTKTTYFTLGEEQFVAMKEQIRKAKHFIFMEFFIIDHGEMWKEIVTLLQEKVAEGVDVRLLYDDFGCISTLGPNYDETLNKWGIKTKVFNRIRAKLAIQMNNRDHRKILVVDGLCAMTGGINLADEYINKKERFGHWKDCGCLIEGPATWSFTVMFLQFWNFDESEENKDDYEQFRVKTEYFKQYEDDGYVQPFADAPTDDENIGEFTHINIINNALHYVYIMTPYLILDQEMKTSLILAAKNGVDVRILVPHIPDKKYVFALTRHNYQELTKHGVKVYEYTPGFVHAKTFVSDDKYAIVGTTNMDFRSYYLHYECGIWFYKSRLIQNMKEDYLNTLKQSHQISYEDCKNVRFSVRITRAFLNLLAPLM